MGAARSTARSPTRRWSRYCRSSARSERLTLQRSAQVGVLTDSSYVQLVHNGVAAIDLGFPCRYTHSSLEMCDLGDLEGLTRLLVAAICRIKAGFSLDRDDYER